MGQLSCCNYKQSILTNNENDYELSEPGEIVANSNKNETLE